MAEDRCRVCLRRGDTRHFISLDIGNPSFRSMMSSLFPDVNLEIVVDPVLCRPCATAMNTAHRLKNTCKLTESKIWTLVQNDAETGRIEPVKLIDVIKTEELETAPNFSSIICDFCEKYFTSDGGIKPSCKMHKKDKYVCDICHTMIIKVRAVKTEGETDEDKFHCHICKKSYCTKYSVVQHLRVIHDVPPEN